jgi:hypothetical protein
MRYQTARRLCLSSVLLQPLLCFIIPFFITCLTAHLTFLYVSFAMSFGNASDEILSERHNF